MKSLLAFISFIIIHAVSLAQQGAVYQVKEYSTDNGLPSNGIKGLQWDESTSFLWIATEAGISRFNGIDFTNFTKENTPGLSHERMAYMVKNKEGTIYTADINGNIFHIKANTVVFEQFPMLKGIDGFKKRHFLGSLGNEIQQLVLAYMLETGNEQWNRLLQLSDTSVIVINGTQRLHYTSTSLKKFIPVSIPFPHSGSFVISGQLFFFDPDRHFYHAKNNFQSFQTVPLVGPGNKPITFTQGNIFLYWETGMSNPILFSGNNAWLLHYRNNNLETELICSAVPTSSYILSAQYSKKNKTLFIGTDSKGIVVIHENRVVSMKKKNSDIRERNAYYSQVALPESNILTNEGHIIGGVPLSSAPTPIKGKFNYTTYTHGDSLWFAQINSRSGLTLLHCYNYKTGQTFVYDKIGAIQESFAMTYSGNRYYFVTSKGMGYLQNDSIRYLFKPPHPQKGQAAPYAMTEFSQNVLGVASCDGLILYNTNTITADTVLRMPGYCIRSLWKYKDYVFVGTYGKGFYIWKDGVIKAMPTDKNNFLLYAHCFVPDYEGYCWISTNRGLFRAQLSDLTDAFENNKPQVYYHYFGKNDGMDITEMNGGCAPCALIMKDSIISFPTMDGLLWVNPEKAKPLLPEGNIYIDEFVAGGIKINHDSLKEKALPFKDRDVLIKLGFSSWCNKENIYLEYRINDNGKWVAIDVNKGAFINLNNLNPGTYKVQIRKLNGFGVNNYSYKEVVFSINAPWHQRWWFYLVSLLAVLGLVLLYLGYRTKRYRIRQQKLEEQVNEKTKELQQQNEVLEKNNSIKTRLISIISHDIVTPLKFLTVAGKNLLEKRKIMPEELQQETIQEITNTSQELQLLSTNILNWIKYQNENRRLTKETFNLHEMTGQVFGILQSLAKQKKLLLENLVDDTFEVHQYYEPLKILVYNLLTNAIHFTEKGAITVSAIRNNGMVMVMVKDEGIGMSEEQVQRLMEEHVIITSANVDIRKGHGLGYLIIKDLLKTMNATMKIESKKGVGTTVSITMEG